MTLGKTVPPNSPNAAMGMGLALVPEDRRKQGLVIDSTSDGTSRRRSGAC